MTAERRANELTRVAIKQGAGLVFLEPISPSNWHGETGCVIGPFSSREITEYFLVKVMHLHQGRPTPRVFAEGYNWYIELGR
jgi:hypothetical protein